ncbi:hypothetical protein NBE98_03155 [Clostridium swellfunianum]|uniref:hypothetical protein n=1 Tax=Clostridium swellfunianum TaxID=1367462 RepID=UPI00203069CB|nr:hypothetical protein [Clostridium swellfunianum]MCM0647373.1 hypothetical protein [Clostridium swellfunianum]
MPLDNFNKITPINGFDTDKNNAMQNNYAWSMSELGEYLYVGTGRNILYGVLLAIQRRIPGFQIPEDIVPDPVDNRAEIWRYNKALPNAGWTRVFKAPEGVSGFRFMIRYTDPQGRTALYAGAFSSPKVKVYRSVDGLNWIEMPNDVLEGTSTRSMVIHTNGKLYMSTVAEGASTQEAFIYEYIPPTAGFPQGNWLRVTADSNSDNFDPNRNPTGQIAIMESFNGHIYAGNTTEEGFELWRTIGTEPAVNGWKLVIDKGAGDSINMIPLTLGVFKDHLYVGAIMFPLFAQNLFSLEAFKPFDLIRINKDDRWELVIGGQPYQPTVPTTPGPRGTPISLLPSGAGNFFNLYCWQLVEYNGELYLGTFDWLVVFFKVLRLPSSSPYSGFDLLKSSDGISWESVTSNGFGNQDNYGARLLFKSTNGHLYVGTANPFEGCEVWENIL